MRRRAHSRDLSYDLERIPVSGLNSRRMQFVLDVVPRFLLLLLLLLLRELAADESES